MGRGIAAGKGRVFGFTHNEGMQHDPAVVPAHTNVSMRQAITSMSQEEEADGLFSWLGGIGMVPHSSFSSGKGGGSMSGGSYLESRSRTNCFTGASRVRSSPRCMLHLTIPPTPCGTCAPIHPQHQNPQRNGGGN